MWFHTNELSYDEKRVRSLYDYLSQELEKNLLHHGLVESYSRFVETNTAYPFVEMRELKPRAKVVESENSLLEGFIVIFAEGAIPQQMKKYIRYFDYNKINKENMGELKLGGVNFSDQFQTQQRYFETKNFYSLLKSLLQVDYALLVTPDTSLKNKNRFALSHYHVRIDWLLDSAAESLGKELRYVSKDLYEKGERHALNMVEKLFEYYSFHHTVSGRRTAALLVAQLLRKTSFHNRIYVCSSESRTVTRLFEKGVCKYTLVKLSPESIKIIEEHANGSPDFRKNFLIHDTDEYGVAILKVVYTHNEHSKPPTDGKLRELKPDVNWLRIRNQLLVPKIEESSVRPIRYQIVYDQADPLS